MNGKRWIRFEISVVKVVREIKKIIIKSEAARAGVCPLWYWFPQLMGKFSLAISCRQDKGGAYSY